MCEFEVMFHVDRSRVDSYDPSPGGLLRASGKGGWMEVKYHVRALARGLQILDAFTPTDAELGLTELSARTGIGKATLVRLLSCLEQTGYLERSTSDVAYQLGQKAYQLALVYQATHPLPTVALPILEHLAGDSGQTCELAVLDGSWARTLAVAYANRALRRQTAVGERFPVHCTSNGKTLVAFLDSAEIERIIAAGLRQYTGRTIVNPAAFHAELAAIRTRGYAFDDEELFVGVRCLSAPVRDSLGRVVAAVNVSGPAAEFDEDSRPRLANLVLRAAGEVSARLGVVHQEAATPDTPANNKPSVHLGDVTQDQAGVR